MEGEVTSDIENYTFSTSSTSPKKSTRRRLFKSLSFKSSSFLSKRTKSSPQVDKDSSRDSNSESSSEFFLPFEIENGKNFQVCEVFVKSSHSQRSRMESE